VKNSLWNYKKTIEDIELAGNTGAKRGGGSLFTQSCRKVTVLTSNIIDGRRHACVSPNKFGKIVSRCSASKK
jgi:hypothetical protein